MTGFTGFANGVMTAQNVDFRQVKPTAGQVTLDGQLLIGAAAFPNIRAGFLASSDSTVTITNGPGTIDLKTGGAVPTTFNADSGSATPALGILTVPGGTSTGGAATNINTDGSGSTLSIRLNNSISQPTTNAAGTSGLYSLGGTRFLHNYAATGLAGNNTFCGSAAGNLTLTGTKNTGVGSSSLSSLTSGNNNTALGYNSLTSDTTGGENTCIGSEAGQNLTGGRNVGVGLWALRKSDGNDNTAVGYVAIGNNAATGNYNCAFGRSSLYKLTSGNGNSGYGYSTLENITTGSNNTCVGYNSLRLLGTGSRNISVGYESGSSYNGAEGSNISIGSLGVAGESNKIRIGKQGSGVGEQNACYIAGIASVSVSNQNLVTIDTTTGQLGSKTTANLTSWTTITSNQTAVPGEGYFCNKAGTLALALPASSSVGDVIEVANINTATGTQFTQAANQQIFIGNTNTTLGAGGTLTSSATGDTLKLVCRTANLVWQAVSGWGNWTVV